MNIIEQLANGEYFEYVDPVGTNYAEAHRQANGIAKNWNVNLVDVLIVLITEIQKKDKQIEMLEYNQSWRKRRP